MLARLGNVLYWLGCGTALVFLAGAALLSAGAHTTGQVWAFVIFGGGCALASWLAGRAARYVLSGN